MWKVLDCPFGRGQACFSKVARVSKESSLGVGGVSPFANFVSRSGI